MLRSNFKIVDSGLNRHFKAVVKQRCVLLVIYSIKKLNSAFPWF